jgi:hypothetical protein
VYRIGHLEDDGAHGCRKRRMAHDGQAQLIVEIPAMVLAKADDVVLLPRGENLVDDPGVSLLGLAGGDIRECKRHYRQKNRGSESGPHQRE